MAGNRARCFAGEIDISCSDDRKLYQRLILPPYAEPLALSIHWPGNQTPRTTRFKPTVKHHCLSTAAIFYPCDNVLEPTTFITALQAYTGRQGNNVLWSEGGDVTSPLDMAEKKCVMRGKRLLLEAVTHISDAKQLTGYYTTDTYVMMTSSSISNVKLVKYGDPMEIDWIYNQNTVPGLNAPVATAFTRKSNDYVIIADHNNHNLHVCLAEAPYTPLRKIGQYGAHLRKPVDIACDNNDVIYVLSQNISALSLYSLHGQMLNTIDFENRGIPYGIRIRPDGEFIAIGAKDMPGRETRISVYSMKIAKSVDTQDVTMWRTLESLRLLTVNRSSITTEL